MEKVVILLAPLPPSPGGIAGWAGRMLNSNCLDDYKIIPIDEKLIGKRKLFYDEKVRVFSEAKRSLRIWYKLVCVLTLNKNSVIHICIPPSYGALLREIISIKICHLFKKKVVVHFRSTIPYLVRKKTHATLYQNVIRNSDFLIYLNEISANYLNFKNSSKISIIPNFLESKHCSSRVVNQTVKTCIYTGGIIPEKGCDIILKIAEKFPQIVFKMCGVVNDSISSKEIPSNVEILGHLSKERIYSELRSADMFLFLSRFSGEGFSNSLLEAMASGLPCFVSDWASNRDMIEDKGGFVVPLDNFEHTLIKFKELVYLSPETRQKMSDWNVNKVRDKYLENSVVRMYTKIYDTLINNSPSFDTI